MTFSYQAVNQLQEQLKKKTEQRPSGCSEMQLRATHSSLSLRDMVIPGRNLSRSTTSQTRIRRHNRCRTLVSASICVQICFVVVTESLVRTCRLILRLKHLATRGEGASWFDLKILLSGCEFVGSFQSSLIVPQPDPSGEDECSMH